MKSTLDQRYRHKLNMQEPGCRMLKIAGALGLTGLLLRWAGATMLSRAALLVLVLLILVRIELHRDRVLNEMALREMQEEEKRGI